MTEDKTGKIVILLKFPTEKFCNDPIEVEEVKASKRIRSDTYLSDYEWFKAYSNDYVDGIKDEVLKARKNKKNRYVTVSGHVVLDKTYSFEYNSYEYDSYFEIEDVKWSVKG